MYSLSCTWTLWRRIYMKNKANTADLKERDFSSIRGHRKLGKSLLSKAELTIWVTHYNQDFNLFPWSWGGQPCALWGSFNITHYRKPVGNTPHLLKLSGSHSYGNYFLRCLVLHFLRECTAFSLEIVTSKMPNNKSREWFQIMRTVTVALGFLSRLVYFPLE